MHADLPAQLMRPGAYPHEVTNIVQVETLLSRVFLTGDYAYKVKKPVQFDYVDFSTLALRKHFCDEELRCNRRYAPELYLDVVPIVAAGDGLATVAVDGATGGARIIEYAVRMRQFDAQAQADRRLRDGHLTAAELFGFGNTLAAQHALLTPITSTVDPVTPMLDNFATLHAQASASHLQASLNRLEQATRSQAAGDQSLLQRRQREGFIRECHGDLHLQNMVLTAQGLRAFDCLEFDRALRVIDVWSDAAFLVMDCCVRGRSDLGYAFIDGYLDHSGDYDGVVLLPLYARYRAMVRAKVAALQLQQSFAQRKRDALDALVAWASSQVDRPPGRLIVTCGVSGSGKSHWAAQLAPALPAIRLRSDVLRKHRHGLPSDGDSRSARGAGIYTEEATRALYRQLARLATGLLQRGENVIIDSANLMRWQRALFHDAAEAAGSAYTLLHLNAPRDVLESRVARRRQAGRDASEADASVLAWQLAHQEMPTADEPALRVAGDQPTLQSLLDALAMP